MPIDETPDNPIVRLIEHEEPIVFSQVFQRISKISLQMSLSYTFSFQMVFLVYLLSQLDDSEDNLAAITLITSLLNAITMIGISPLLAISLIAGHEVGELNHAEHNHEDDCLLQSRRDHIAGVYRNGLLISTVMMPLMISGMVFSKPLLTGIFNQQEKTADIAAEFIRYYALSIPAILIRICSEQVMFSFGRTKPAMLMGLINFILCMGIGSVLAFGAFGTKPLGKKGVLIGCIIETYLTAFSFSFYIAHNSRFNLFQFFNFFKPFESDHKQLKKILKLSRLMLFTMMIETAMDFTTSVLAGLVGIKEQAALSVTMQFSLLSFLLQAAFGQSCSQEMSRELGKKQYLKVSQLGKYGLVTTLMYTTPIPLLLGMYPNILMHILNEHNKSTQKILHHLAPIIFLGTIIDAARFSLLQQLRILGDVKSASVISSACLVLGMSTAAFLGLRTQLGIYGVAIGYTSGIFLATLAILYRWLQRIEPLAIQTFQEKPKVLNKRVCPFLFFKGLSEDDRKNSTDGTQMVSSNKKLPTSQSDWLLPLSKSPCVILADQSQDVESPEYR